MEQAASEQEYVKHMDTDLMDQWRLAPLRAK